MNRPKSAICIAIIVFGFALPAASQEAPEAPLGFAGIEMGMELDVVKEL